MGNSEKIGYVIQLIQMYGGIQMMVYGCMGHANIWGSVEIYRGVDI